MMASVTFDFNSHCFKKAIIIKGIIKVSLYFYTPIHTHMNCAYLNLNNQEKNQEINSNLELLM